MCNFKCTSKNDLNRHVSSVHERKKPFNCELCEKSFAVIPYMRNHFARIHKGEQHGICKICEYICSSKYTWNKSILNLFMKKSHFSVKCVNETSHGVFIWRIMLPEFKRKLLDVHSAAMDVLLKRTWMGLLRAFMTKRSLTNVDFAKKVFQERFKIKAMF